MRNPRKAALPRTKCPEEVLLFIIQEIRRKRKDKLNPDELQRLEKMEKEEERELRRFEMQALVAETRSCTNEGEKRPRQSGESLFYLGFRCWKLMGYFRYRRLETTTR